MIVNLDVYCLNRPFDDQSQDRIHLEAEAVLAIIRHIEQSEMGWGDSTTVIQNASNF